MSEEDPEKQKQDKKNTDLWKMKQDEKKRKKEAEKEAGGDQPKQDKKDKKKKEKVKEEGRKDSVDQTADKKDTKANAEQPPAEKPVEPVPLAPSYCKLLKVGGLLSQKERESQIHQEQLINKYMDQCISENDIILYMGEQSRNPTSQQVYVKDFNTCTEAELVCRYSDLSYFLEGSVTKIFIEAEYIFSNGSILAKQGALNVALMGKYYNIPVLAVGGSWLYNGWGPVNNEALQEKYGPVSLKQLDWIQQKYLTSTIMEVGVTNPRQVSIYPPIIYKQLSLEALQW